MKILIPILCFCIAGCAAESRQIDIDPALGDPAEFVATLTNSDITWNGNFLGLWAHVEGEAGKQLLKLGKAASPALRSVLSDPNKFAAAHVLLTKIEMEEYKVSASHWNKLKVDLHADGTVDLHPEQIDKIKTMWEL